MRSRPRRGLLATVGLMAASLLMIPTPSLASGGGDPSGFSATPLTAASVVDGAKSITGQLAQSDPSLLGRTDATMVSVMVKLDYDATATYAGDIEGLAATSPLVTGVKLTGSSQVEKSYEAYTSGIDATFRNDVSAAIPSARVGRSVSRVYGGVAMQLPANQIGALLALPNVAAVQSDTLSKPQTDSSTAFIGAPTVWAQEGGQANAGKGVIFADLDTGLWPEHPSFADTGVTGAPPAPPSGVPRVCDFGDNPLTPASDVFTCNNKLIGGEPFLDTYGAAIGFGSEAYPDSARDSNGHGTHTSSTAAGDIVNSAQIFGVERGPISGIAPGAWVIEYKVCGLEGCFGSDSAAAVAQAILDGVDVINFSISGGSNPFADPVELAFLDAYNAGITVAASAGNSGPGAATTDHHSPWVITVAASTQQRAFQSTLSLVADGGASLQLVGSTITAGVSTNTPVVLAENVAGYTGGNVCGEPFAPGSLTGMIVACQRGGANSAGAIGRVQKGYNALQGGATGMILYNPTLADTETDNHFLPAVHLADGTNFLAFYNSHTNVQATFTAGQKANGQGDVMAAFSSRGPGGLFLKPDITAPGVQILAGNTPTPDEIPSGPPGQYFQAIAGTSMSAPHIAGSAILIQALHPNWGPGAIKSALMTTAKTSVVKEDTVTPADPFDDGAGRVDLTKAGAAAIVFEDSATNMFAHGNDPLTAMNVNIPSINVPTMPGSVHVVRTARNVTNKNYDFNITTTAPAGSKIKVVPDHGRIKPGKSQTFDIYITSSAPEGQYFGQINLKSSNNGPMLHLPVAFFNQQGSLAVTQECAPTSIKIGNLTVCTINATNNSFNEATVSAVTTVTDGLRIDGATGATLFSQGHVAKAGPTTLGPQQDASPTLVPGSSPAGGYLPLSAFGITPTAIGDEQVINFNVPEFEFAGKLWNELGIDSNGYLVAGGGGALDNDCCTIEPFPDQDRPNGVMAPFWTDLDGTGAPGIYAGILTDGADSWIVVEWQENVFGTTDLRTFQTWIGVNGDANTGEDISYTYSAAPANPNGQPFKVGVENSSGTAGYDFPGLPDGSDLVVQTTPGAPGGSLSYTLNIRGRATGGQLVKTSVASDTVAGLTQVQTAITVTRH